MNTPRIAEATVEESTDFDLEFTKVDLTVNPGEDIILKIMSVYPTKGICVLSATGYTSRATVQHEANHYGMTIYEEQLEIKSLSGIFLSSAYENGFSKRNAVEVFVTLGGGDSKIITGSVGSLIAASQVQIVLAIYPPEDDTTT